MPRSTKARWAQHFQLDAALTYGYFPMFLYVFTAHRSTKALWAQQSPHFAALTSSFPIFFQYSFPICFNNTQPHQGTVAGALPGGIKLACPPSLHASPCLFLLTAIFPMFYAAMQRSTKALWAKHFPGSSWSKTGAMFRGPPPKEWFENRKAEPAETAVESRGVLPLCHFCECAFSQGSGCNMRHGQSLGIRLG